MSSSQITILNCGASQFAFGVFSLDGNAPTLERMVTRDLSYDFSEEDQWLSATLGALREATSEDKISGEVQVILPGFLLLTKTLRIAHVEGGKQAQMIAYEAQQSIPYQLSDLNWSFQVLSDDGIETEVLFIGIRSEICQRFCDEISKLGFQTVSVNASTILDYNAFQLAYPDESENALVINIGARASNLTFVQESGFFVRNINLGGNALTQGLADGLGKSFAEAEKIKVNYFVSEHTDHSSTEIIDSASMTFMRKLSQEVTRSIVNFRQQKKGGAPKKIYLTGRSALIPGLTEFLTESQRVEVAFFQPGHQIELGAEANLAADSMEIFQASELIGEAAKEKVENGVGVDLLPEELRKEISFKKKRPWIVAAAALLAVSPLPFIVQAKQEYAVYNDAAERVRSQLPARQGELAKIEALIEEIDAAKVEVDRFDDLVNSKSNWILFFSELQSALFDIGDVWLDELVVNRTGSGNNIQFELTVDGRLLVRDPDSDRVVGMAEIDETLLSERIRTLSDVFLASPFISERLSLRIDFQSIQEGQPLLPFEFTFAIEPQRAL
ncbi:MAG: pilus assembly protein PilM [Verrucomicrobiota bacterium]